MDALLEQNN